MSNAPAVLRIFGLIALIFSATMTLPLAVSWWLHDGAERVYRESLAVTLAAGALLWLATRRHTEELKVRDGFLLVVLVWMGLPAVATLPLLLYFPAMSFTDAYFETVSGLTASGATVVEGLDKLPFSINLWRAEMVWLGGMGLIVLAVAILPLLGVGGRQIFKAEAPGPMKEAKLTPRMAETAKGLWLVYGAISAACFAGYSWAGMSWNDALIHTFTTMGLGGFSSHDASFGFWNSPRIEAVAILFMTLAGMNFATHFLVLHRRSLKPYAIDPEVKGYLLVTFGSVLGVALYLWQKGTYPDLAEALRYAAFNVVSIATTTGYTNTDYNLWPMFAPLWMLFLSSFATCSGSTGGGIKMVRAFLLYKQVFRELLRAMHPAAVTPLKLGGETVPNAISFAVLAFGFMYMVSIVSLTLALSASGLDIVTAFSAAVASINNVGPGLNRVGPATTYASLSDFQTWVCTLGMLVGRLEIFTLLVVLTPAFWRK
ncbi:MAG TPA: potassium transporter Trk [Rhodocyclaceae bacterium]|nr:MAG: potassium transporter Trk [Betaproteobacteria bacterium CG2_30_68_42]PJA56830.1 MAG: potassium transporter Trk [Rhodocyclales bacterium CG_4_9_14_3_um_filter_68_10]HCX33823.1 potassium transporter Trk [Rhodocyclaceae bacterium]